MDLRPRVGVSRCLLGDAVRYDGGARPAAELAELRAAGFDLLPVCPELEVGMGVPRPPVDLVGPPGAPRLIDRTHDRDWTDAMQAFAARRLAGLDPLDGFVLKARSPSCGAGTARRYGPDGALASAAADGLFTAALRRRWPGLPLIDEAGLPDPSARGAFVAAVRTHHANRQGVRR